MNINHINKICIFIVVLQWLSFPAFAAETVCAFGKTFQPETRIYNALPSDLNLLLPKLKNEFPDKNRRLKALADMYMGAFPYCADTLTEESRNWFPYRQTNCTLFVLYLAAFMNSSSFEEACEHMRLLHYRNGIVGFKGRYHFTADRITAPENRYFSENTLKYVKNRSELKNISLVLNRTSEKKSFFKGRLDHWKRAVSVDYIPREGFSTEELKDLPEVIGIAFIKRSNWGKGIIVGHEGLLINGDLCHSSPSSGVNIIKNYLSIEFAGSKWEGIVFFSINEVFLHKEGTVK